MTLVNAFDISAVDFVTNIKTQDMSFERIQEKRDDIRNKLKEFVGRLTQNHDTLPHEVGASKTDNSAIKKAKRDYNGDLKKVTDYERAKIIIDNAKQLIMLQNELQGHLDEFGAEAVIANYFANPKDPTHYRCANIKIRFPFGDKNSGIEYHTVELQVVAKHLEEIYDKTHPYKRRAEDIEMMAQHRGLTEDEELVRDYCYAICRYHNNKAAQIAGYNNPTILTKKNIGDYSVDTRHKEDYRHKMSVLKRLDEPQAELQCV